MCTNCQDAGVLWLGESYHFCSCPEGVKHEAEFYDYEDMKGRRGCPNCSPGAMCDPCLDALCPFIGE